MFHLFRASYVYKCIHVEISCRLGLNLAKSAQKPRLGNFPQWKLSRAKFPETFRKFSVRKCDTQLRYATQLPVTQRTLRYATAQCAV
jgi:hypothetical protein